MSEAFGIDFGTTNSVLAMATGTTVDVIPLDDQIPAEWANMGFDRVLPTVIGFDGDNPLFGWVAKRRVSGRLEAVKRMLATEDSVMVGGVELRVEEAAAMFFRNLQERAAAAGALTRLDQAVVTIPANSRGTARYRTKLAAGLAGIEVLALINEPTAAAMAHASQIGHSQRILVFDFGGGTLDVTVLQAVEGTFIEQASKGIQRLGGIDLDAAFLAHLESRITSASTWSDEDRSRFRLALELAKIELSSRDATQVPLPGGGYLEASRADFETAARPLLERTCEPVRVCMADSPGKIDHLVMVGGSSKIPLVQRLVAQTVGTEPDQSVDPMTAIAEGAAIAAGILTGVVTDLDFFVGTEHALGTIVQKDRYDEESEFSVLISRNTKLPARATDDYRPAEDFQEAVDVRVIEGDPSLPVSHEDNVILKNWVIQLAEKRPASEAAFSITYQYDVDGILHVRVVDHKTEQVMIDDEISFGASGDKRRLPEMRRHVDEIMRRDAQASGGRAASPAAGGLSPESEGAIQRARKKVIPFVSPEDAAMLDELIAALEGSDASNEPVRRRALEVALRSFAYLM